jgi:hypothetical protein
MCAGSGSALAGACAAFWIGLLQAAPAHAACGATYSTHEHYIMVLVGHVPLATLKLGAHTFTSRVRIMAGTSSH